ncbi:MAG: hypothetical protein IT352_07490 [Gemmatimonadales bacterium]|nr:hypothetical protein [Gemmatimonadales bacterium]
MSLIAQVTVYVNAPTQPPASGVSDTVVTPSPVRTLPGGSAVLSVDVIDGGVQRAAKGFAFAPFVSGVPTGAPSPALYRQQDGKPNLKVNELLLEIPASFPAGTSFTLNIQGT